MGPEWVVREIFQGGVGIGSKGKNETSGIVGVCVRLFKVWLDKVNNEVVYWDIVVIFWMEMAVYGISGIWNKNTIRTISTSFCRKIPDLVDIM